ncbi:MAG: ABC transporter substrate-binding protein [Prevotella sp.]|nr:ABC transporter substrate-binding protein [Prevotella sp.]
MKKYLAMFLAAVCLFVCFGVTVFADDPIVIGILQDTTGGTATLGKSVQKGVEDAIADINADGGIGGKEVQFIEYDTAANVDTAIAAYIKAVTVDEVDFIIAPPIANIVNGLKAMTASFEDNYYTWLEYMYVSFIAHFEVPDYDKEANHQLTEIINNIS